MNNKIDFVITWVNGKDENWLNEKKKYTAQKVNDDSTARYRDWELLKYWFRGVEKYAPWVNNIFFVTWGHYPDWLNVENEKLRIVKHEDYIPNEYLPTFNSHTIELNLHRIKDLSEDFVYFNDDTFIVDTVKQKDFFYKGMPCDSAVLSPYIPTRYDDLSIMYWNMVGIINKHFNKNKQIRRNIFKWINFKYKTKLPRTILMMPWPRFGGFYETHIPNSYKKDTLEEVWKEEKEILNLTCIEKFRNLTTHINQWIFRYWQIAKGNFYPRKIDFGVSFDLSDNDYNNILEFIVKQKRKIVCLNDSSTITDFNNRKKQLIEAFEKILPQKSSFER